MNQTSSIQNGAITLTAASFVPIIDWAASALPSRSCQPNPARLWVHAK
jgi:hypothetical protein